MIRRFNYTGRSKIPRHKVDIVLLKDNEGKYFKAKITWDGLKFPDDAKVYIEANYKGVYQRFSFGTISNFKEPESTRLSELPETELAYFDISVVDETGNIGLLLGQAKGIAINADGTPADKIPLLPVNPADLKSQFWKLTFDATDDGRPVLEINRNIPGIFEIAKENIYFKSLVYPTAFRGVLLKLIEYGDFDTDVESWVTQWRKFLTTTLGINYFPEMENESFTGITPDQEAWIDDCVNEFCKKLHLFEKFISQ